MTDTPDPSDSLDSAGFAQQGAFAPNLPPPLVPLDGVPVPPVDPVQPDYSPQPPPPTQPAVYPPGVYYPGAAGQTPGPAMWQTGMPPGPPPPPAKSSKRGCWIAVAIVGGLLALLLVFVIGIAVGSASGTDTSSTFRGVLSDDPSTVYATLPTLSEGACVKTTEDSVTTVSCSKVHDAEVSGTVDFATATPDSTVIDDRVLAGEGLCQLHFRAFVGSSYYDSRYAESGAIVPDDTAWSGGARTVICLVYDVDGPTSSKLRNSER